MGSYLNPHPKSLSRDFGLCITHKCRGVRLSAPGRGARPCAPTVSKKNGSVRIGKAGLELTFFTFTFSLCLTIFQITSTDLCEVFFIKDFQKMWGMHSLLLLFHSAIIVYPRAQLMASNNFCAPNLIQSVVGSPVRDSVFSISRRASSFVRSKQLREIPTTLAFLMGKERDS
jgi:hypothetical protein